MFREMGKIAIVFYRIDGIVYCSEVELTKTGFCRKPHTERVADEAYQKLFHEECPTVSFINATGCIQHAHA